MWILNTECGFSLPAAEWTQRPAALRPRVYWRARPQLHRQVPRQHPPHSQRQGGRRGLPRLLLRASRGLFPLNHRRVGFEGFCVFWNVLVSLLAELPTDRTSSKRICTSPGACTSWQSYCTLFAGSFSKSTSSSQWAHEVFIFVLPSNVVLSEIRIRVPP